MNAPSNTLEPRPAVRAIPRVVHGAVKDHELALLERSGISPEAVLDFSVNGNPLGVSPGVLAAVRSLTEPEVRRYPDDEATDLREGLARRFGLEPSNVLAGNGSSELLWLACLTYVQPGDRVIIAGPTFGEYERAALIMGAEIVRIDATPADSFRLRVAELKDMVISSNPRLVFLCNPNNPTGTYLDAHSIETLAAAAPRTLWVVDEAYAPFVSGVDALRACIRLMHAGNILLVRSLTKDHAFAGIRLGYALGADAIVDALVRVKPPWSVSRVAIAAGLAALEDDAHVSRGRAVASEAIGYLQTELRALGLHVFETRTNFMLVDALPYRSAAALRVVLLKHGIVVRDCASFGLPSTVRIAARPLEDCRRLVAAFAVETSRQNS
jgi:histidinol-phosphate aminotransferase